MLDIRFDVGLLLGWLLGTGIVGSLMFYGVRRWIERPRIRLYIRDAGLFQIGGGGSELVFEIANGGSRPAALHPVIRLRAEVVNPARRSWYPDWFCRLVDEETIQRRHLMIPIDKPFVSPAIDEYYDVSEDQDLRLPAQSGARRLEAKPRRPDKLGWLLVFLVYEFRLEGKRKRIRVNIPTPGSARVSRARMFFSKIAFILFGRFPGDAGPANLTEFHATKQARDDR